MSIPAIFFSIPIFRLDEADDFVERLEAMLEQISAYWGRPLHGVIECYVIRNLDEFPLAATIPAGIGGVRTAGGVTLMQSALEGKRHVAKSIVYAAARLEVVATRSGSRLLPSDLRPHRAGVVFRGDGRGGPLLTTKARRSVPTRARSSFSATTRRNRSPSPCRPSRSAATRWQNYASRWALCHFLVTNPNYSRQFRQLGRGLLAGKDVSFEQTFAYVHTAVVL